MSGKHWVESSKELLQPLLDAVFCDDSDRKVYDAVIAYVGVQTDISCDDFIKIMDSMHAHSVERLKIKQNMIGSAVKNCGFLGAGTLLDFFQKYMDSNSDEQLEANFLKDKALDEDECQTRSEDVAEPTAVNSKK